MDILTGSYTGELYLFRRKKDGSFAGRRLLRDENGANLKIPYSVTPEAIDMDADGDLDLVVGTRTGPVYVVENIGTRAVPVWSKHKRPLKTTDGEVIKGSNAHHADWDGDGIRDLVLGSEYGAIRWYRNVGKNDWPRYAGGGELVKKGTFERLEEGENPGRPGSRTKVPVADWNSDGLADLQVGDVAWQSKTLAPLSAEEQAEKVALEPGYKDISRRMRANTDAWLKMRKLMQPIPAEFTKRRRALLAEFTEYVGKMRKFDRNKESRVHGWVWLYLRKNPAAGRASAVAAAADVGAKEPRTVAMRVTSVPAAAKPGDTVEVRVTLKIADGWHTYADVPKHSSYPLTIVKLDLPKHVQAVGDWWRPEGQPSDDDADLSIYKGVVTFVRKVRVNAVPVTIRVHAAFQACDESVCLPPDSCKQELRIGSKQ